MTPLVCDSMIAPLALAISVVCYLYPFTGIEKGHRLRNWGSSIVSAAVVFITSVSIGEDVIPDFVPGVLPLLVAAGCAIIPTLAISCCFCTSVIPDALRVAAFSITCSYLITGTAYITQNEEGDSMRGLYTPFHEGRVIYAASFALLVISRVAVYVALLRRK